MPQYNLGVMYTIGHGVPQDYVRAHMWFNFVRFAGSNKVLPNIETSIAALMTSAQIAEAQKLTRE